MEKLVYLLRTDRDGEDLRKELLSFGHDVDTGASRVVVNVTDGAVAAGKGVTIGKLDPPIRAMVSLWMESSDDREPVEKGLAATADSIAGYLVVESVPLVNTDHVAAPGERTPGVNMVTCINQLPSISREQFLDLWYREHKQVAIETQSTFGYTRNTVVRPLTERAPHWDGIVEELFPIEALTDQKAWYAAASDEELQEKTKRMMDSVQAFLDLGAIESHPMSRYEL